MTEDAARRIRLRYDGRCATCGTALAAGSHAWWSSAAKTATCEGCHASGEVGEDLPPVDPGTAGGSAQREFEWRRAGREQRVRESYPRLGGLLLALFGDPQSTTAWAKGAQGERQLAARLEALAARTGMILLHDRRIPGSRANIDHLVVAPGGVFVVDAKRYKGQVQRRDVGGLFRRDVRLFVGGRDVTRLVAGMRRQVEAVRRAGGDALDGLPVIPAICFVGAEWALFSRPFDIDGVWVGWPRALGDLLERPGALTPEGIDFFARQLAAGLPPA